MSLGKQRRYVFRRTPIVGRIEELEPRCLLATYPTGFVTDTVVSGLNAAVVFDWAPDGRMFIGEKSGVIKVRENGAILPTPFVDLSSNVNNAHDRGMLGIAVHPEFPQQPYVYALYTYDPPGATADAGHSRVSRLSRYTADPAGNYNRAIAGSEVVLLGTNSTLANIPQPNDRNPTLPACGNIGAYVQDCIPADEISHTIGTVRFGKDGSLFVGSGDGGNFTSAQNYNVRSQDIHSLAGKILRIHPLTGDGYANNPFFNGDFDANRSKVYSYGLRNPFRFDVDPVSGEPFIGDVGWGSWEEVNRGRGANFGWPCYEGGSGGTSLQQSSYASFPQCQQLYANPNVTAAAYAYSHSGNSSSIGVGSFYTGSVYPAPYRDAMFFFDYSRQEIRTMTFGANRAVGSVSTFGTAVGGITQILAGPDSNLYFTNVLTGSIHRLRYAGAGNVAPTAVASMVQTGINSFAFSSVGSFDPNGDTMTYLWNFGDGTTSTLANPSKTYASAGTYTVTLRVTDPAGLFGTDTSLRPRAGNTPPVANIVSPTVGATYRIGNMISLTGSATDAQDGALPGSSLSWNVRMHHLDHVHLDYFNAVGSSASFLAGDHEDGSYLEICLTAIDSVGATHEKCTNLQPQTVIYTLNSNPSGLTLNYSGVNYTTPFQATIPINAVRTIAATSPQSSGWNFSSWSDGGAATHAITAAATPQSLLATYTRSSNTGSQFILRASGTTGDEEVQIQIDRVPVATFNLSTVPLDYYYRHATSVAPSRVRVAFINDLYAPPVDRSVRVDRLTLDGIVHQAEAASVLSTGTWDAATGCAPGYKRSEELHCDGFLHFAAASSTSLIVLKAAGDTGQEQIELQVNDVPVANFSLSTTLQDYYYVHSAVVSASVLRVVFTNDLYAPPLDRNVRLDKLTLNGAVYEAEAATVFSTGTWDPGTGCNPGYKRSELLHCGGYLQFAAPSNSMPIVVRALGTTGEETISIQINQIPVATFALSTSFADFTYTHSGSVTADQVRVEFTNNGVSAQGADRNVRIDHIRIDGTTYESEGPDVYSTGTWDAATGCAAGNKQSEFIHCDGFMQFGQPAPLVSSVVLLGAGATGEEAVAISVDDQTVANFRLTTSMANYTYRHAGTALRPEQVRVKFVNPGVSSRSITRKARIDRIAINSVLHQSEAPTVYSTGTWDAVNGCRPGFKRSELLQCQGYFQFGTTGNRGTSPPAFNLAEVPRSPEQEDYAASVAYVMETVFSSDDEKRHTYGTYSGLQERQEFLGQITGSRKLVRRGPPALFP
jgi:glucose/arabinose dehydrogenase